VRSLNPSGPWHRRWIAFLLLAPVALVAGAYAWLAVAHGTPWLWNVVVHESGHYTLGGTVLFFRHHLREIPIDVVMALTLATAVATTSPDVPRRPARWAAVLALLLVGLTFVLSAMEEGAWEATRDLLQFRTRDDDVRYGSHWRFHLLSTIWFACAAQALAAVSSGSVRLLRAEGTARSLALASWAVIIVFTLIFGLTAEPFTSARYIGHQAREIMTHGVITLPFVFAIGVRPLGISSHPRPAGVFVTILAWLAVLLIPLFLAIAFSRTGLEETAQLSEGVSGVVASHVFEHVLDYILVFLLTIAMIGGRARPAS
jgi:hypothetical protein